MSDVVRNSFNVTQEIKSPEMIDVELSDFEVNRLIGKGAYGKVFQARLGATGDLHAIKVIRKDKLVS